MVHPSRSVRSIKAYPSSCTGGGFSIISLSLLRNLHSVPAVRCSSPAADSSVRSALTQGHLRSLEHPLGKPAIVSTHYLLWHLHQVAYPLKGRRPLLVHPVWRHPTA